MYLLNTSCIELGLLKLPSIAAFTAFCPFASVQGEEAAALGAGLGEGLEIYGELAIGVVATAIKGSLLPAQLLHQLATTLRTLNTNLNLEGFGILAIRVTAAG